MDMKKIIVAVIVLISATVAIIIISNDYEEESIPTISMDKIMFASEMSFEFRIVAGDNIYTSSGNVQRLVNPRSEDFDPFYTELVFVCCEEKAADFPDNIVVAWPRCKYFINGMAVGMGLAANHDAYRLARHFPFQGQIRNTLYIEDFGLSYPITFDDFINNWEKVAALWRSLRGEQSEIRHAAHVRGRGLGIMGAENPKLEYALYMGFIFHAEVEVDGEKRFLLPILREDMRILRERLLRNDSAYDLIFLHDGRNVENFENTIFAWPNLDDGRAYRLLAEINTAIQLDESQLMHRGRQFRNVINIEDFGLLYPLTINDMVENWEKVGNLWDYFPLFEQDSIRWRINTSVTANPETTRIETNLTFPTAHPELFITLNHVEISLLDIHLGYDFVDADGRRVRDAELEHQYFWSGRHPHQQHDFKLLFENGETANLQTLSQTGMGVLEDELITARYSILFSPAFVLLNTTRLQAVIVGGESFEVN